MGLACLSLPHTFENFEELEAMAIEAARRWARAQKPPFEQSRPPTLKELCDRLQTSRLDLLSDLLKAQVELLGREVLNQEFADCPRCHITVRRKRFEPKAVSTMHGRFTVVSTDDLKVFAGAFGQLAASRADLNGDSDVDGSALNTFSEAVRAHGAPAPARPAM